MKPVSHIITSGIVATVFYMYFKSPFSSFVCFLSGVIIDADHILDHYLHYRSFAGGFKYFYKNCLDIKYDKLYFILHSFELILILWLLVIINSENLLLIAIAVGLTQHLLFDQIGNRKKIDRFGYFFIFRLYKGFRKGCLSRNESKIKA